ncbi:hypothetical protein ACIBL3_46570 [Kribbella sp. NPDC050124]|uniref:hypothetical protein n=1 Tax=Kribbella sp. NPDC050124 TaxID=3364114 RepID=UPI00378A09C0
MTVTRGFVGRRTADSSRVPPGQYVTRDFPVLSAGPTPYTPLDAWDFTIRGAVDKPVSWSWTELPTRAAHALAFSDGGYTTNIASCRLPA